MLKNISQKEDYFIESKIYRECSHAVSFRIWSKNGKAIIVEASK